MSSSHITSVKPKKTFILIAVLLLIITAFVCYSIVSRPAKVVENNHVNNAFFQQDTIVEVNSLLKNILGEQEVIEKVKSEKCRSALLNYLDNNDLKYNWELYSILKGGEQFTPLDTAVSYRKPRFEDFAVIIRNIETDMRKVVVFGFKDDESLGWINDFDIPEEKDVAVASSEVEEESKEEAYLILVSKQEMSLSVYDTIGKELYKFPIACSAVFGNKKMRGDHKTPEGLFPITQVLYSAYIPHDFKDGKGEIPGAYGPYFLRLGVPGYIDIGIHGTHAPESMGTRVTEGCIRLTNDNILILKSLVDVGTTVIVTTSIEDVKK